MCTTNKYRITSDVYLLSSLSDASDTISYSYNV